MGYSIGRWEGDTFVVTTSGLTDRSWLDVLGHPHTEALVMTERFRRVDAGTWTSRSPTATRASSRGR
jgi:hypothetical protein